MNPSGNDEEGYDMRYTKDDKMKYVEVKSSKNEVDSFNISKGEIEFGETHKEDYELWLIMNCMDKEKRRILNLGNIFAYKSSRESFTDNSNFSVENDNFIVSFSLKQD